MSPPPLQGPGCKAIYVLYCKFVQCGNFMLKLLTFTLLLSCIQGEGFTALHCACQQGHLKVVQVLVSAGANMDIQIPLVSTQIIH